MTNNTNQNDRFNAVIKLDVEDFYNVVNALRDACGCDNCVRIANAMLAQRHDELNTKTHVFVCCDGLHAQCGISTLDEATRLAEAHVAKFSNSYDHNPHIVQHNDNILPMSAKVGS